jgi:hypothetical protein
LDRFVYSGARHVGFEGPAQIEKDESVFLNNIQPAGMQEGRKVLSENG